MRTITDHKLNGLNDALEITVLDEPGQGGACHEYEISWGDVQRGPKPTIAELEAILEKDSKAKISIQPNGGIAIGNTSRIKFQNGPVKEAGLNGISGEALLAIVIDRLRSFQAGPNPSNENMHALIAATDCLGWLQKRTRDRLARGVEGTNQE